jgi:hypothetical protein
MFCSGSFGKIEKSSAGIVIFCQIFLKDGWFKTIVKETTIVSK